MAVRLTLLCQGLTPAARAGVLGSDGEPDPPSARVLGQARARLEVPLARGAEVRRAPSLAAARTAQQLGLDAVPDGGLRDADYGRWAGRTLAEVRADDPDAAASWMGEQDSAAPGGESLSGLVERVGAWLDGYGLNGHGKVAAGELVVITGAAVVRALAVHALQAPVPTFWRLDVEPWSVLGISRHGEHWNLRISPAR